VGHVFNVPVSKLDEHVGKPAPRLLSSTSELNSSELNSSELNSSELNSIELNSIDPALRLGSVPDLGELLLTLVLKHSGRISVGDAAFFISLMGRIHDCRC
jgi:hypothetical protein